MQKLTIENWLQRNARHLQSSTQFRVAKLTEKELHVFVRKYSRALSYQRNASKKSTVTHDGIANGILNKMQIGQYDRNV